jgi:hypothetical protein
MSKNQVRNVSILTVIALIFGVFFYVISPASVDISKINWEDIPGIIAINNHERNEQTGILTIKLSDGTEEFLPGIWDINYGKEGRTYIYGKTSRESDEQVINYIEPSGRIRQLGFNLFDGSINNVSESPDSTYLLIDFETVDS